ncbi:glycosyl transferase [Pseudomonas prosekii]|uniref:Glycosyl transferase n=1 Tax=Pseudomonas prosekii TaxID=1148509 RepID=A0A3L8CBP2_9PSED|nr:glycosyltransferase [Pseudomonas prosekii]RLU05622.1 glycosyl transferase [Pseudomonas prosekii]RLU13635.1 glycosyl transferase [Pseudomonas prosekii]
MLSGSVVVSCYNQENYIEECLDSILAQEINFDCEIIVSDDCSTDRTQEILKSYSEKHPGKIELLLRRKNVGAALNYHGVHKLATGDIVYHFDGDDVMLPGKLQRQHDVFIADDSVNVVFHKAIYFSDDGQYSSETQYPDHTNDGLSLITLEELARWGAIAVHSSYAYRRTSRKAIIDREFMEWFFAIDSLLPDSKAAYINAPLVKYRCNASVGSYLSTTQGKLKAYKIYLNDLYGYFATLPNLRKDLYSNFLITILAKIKSTGKMDSASLLFLLRNLHYFRPARFFDTVSVRKRVGPRDTVR